MKNYFLIYLPILLSYNITAMNNVNLNNYKSSINYILNNSFIDDIKKYLDNGGYINDFNCNGENLLILAIKKNDLQSIKFLLDNNALVSLLNNEANNALDYAKENGNPEIIEILQQKYNQEKESLKLNSIEIDFKKLKSDFHMLKNGNILDNSNNTFNNLTNINNSNLNHSDNIDNRRSRFFCSLSNYLRNHKDVKSLNKDWQCDQCQKSFSRKGNLKQHEETVHALNKKLKCNHCKKTFKNKYTLNKHKKIIHNLNQKLSNKLNLKYGFCDYRTNSNKH